MAYLLDTNILIRSKNEMPFDLWPTFWRKMQEMISNGQVFSCDMVKHEIESGNDDLKEWISENAPISFFIQADSDVLQQFTATQNWANSNTTFTPAALRDYATKADAYLVATAKAKNMTLVTYEKPKPESKRSVKIPDACEALGVRYCDLNTVLSELGITI